MLSQAHEGDPEHDKQLTIIGRGRAKYHDLLVASRSIICRGTE